MGFQILITDSALEDLKGIVGFIAVDDPAAAVRVGEKLVDQAMSLGIMPTRCPLHDKDRGIRKMTINPYLIYFACDETNNMVHILHFWHGARLNPDF